MKKSVKILSAVLCVFMALSLAACGGKSTENDNKESTEATEPVTQVNAETTNSGDVATQSGDDIVLPEDGKIVFGNKNKAENKADGNNANNDKTTTKDTKKNDNTKENKETKSKTTAKTTTTNNNNSSGNNKNGNRSSDKGDSSQGTTAPSGGGNAADDTGWGNVQWN